MDWGYDSGLSTGPVTSPQDYLGVSLIMFYLNMGGHGSGQGGGHRGIHGGGYGGGHGQCVLQAKAFHMVPSEFTWYVSRINKRVLELVNFNDQFL